MWTCPNNPQHNQFLGTAHVTQTWVINNTGGFLRAVDECLEVTHAPDRNDCVGCVECGADAIWNEVKEA